MPSKNEAEIKRGRGVVACKMKDWLDGEYERCSRIGCVVSGTSINLMSTLMSTLNGVKVVNNPIEVPGEVRHVESVLRQLSKTSGFSALSILCYLDQRVGEWRIVNLRNDGAGYELVYKNKKWFLRHAESDEELEKSCSCETAWWGKLFGVEKSSVSTMERVC